MIDFNDWQKIQIQIGTIIKAEKIEKAEKLLHLTVDFSGEIKEVVSGIAKAYNPEDLVDKQCAFVINLAPREMFGIESQAMILACHDENDLPVLLFPDKKVKSGSKIS